MEKTNTARNKRYNNIADFVREARAKKGLTQIELSEKLGYVTGQFISNVERGLCGIPFFKLKDLVRYTKCDKELLVNAILTDIYEELMEELRRKKKEE